MYDETGKTVGCSAASDMGDWSGNNIGQGLCDCADPTNPYVVDVPMPAWHNGWRVTMDFTT